MRIRREEGRSTCRSVKNERFRNTGGFDFHFSERIRKGEGCVLRYSKTNYLNSSEDGHNGWRYPQVGGTREHHFNGNRLSQTKRLKTRRIPLVRCTLCWAVLVGKRHFRLFI